MRIAATVALFFLSVMPSVAGTDVFRGLSWGMTEEGVLAVYEGLFLKEDESGDKMRVFARVKENTEIAGTRFDAIRYVFKEGRLVAVVARMEPRRQESGRPSGALSGFYLALAALESSYGPPASRFALSSSDVAGRKSSATWGFGNTVCDLSYEESDSGDASLWYTLRYAK